SVLHQFYNATGPAGNCYGRLIQGKDGALYGTGYATAFKMTLNGELTVLHDFNLNAADGSNLVAGVVQAADATLYGTAAQGGAFGHGTVFKISPLGSFTVLYSFTGTTDGNVPYGGLCLASDGNLYGTTAGGGLYGYGTIFRITTSGVETVLHSFDYNHDGAQPECDLVEGSDHRLYGTTLNGGLNFGGTAFVISLDGGFSLLHAFDDPASARYAGSIPLSGVIQASDGFLYGTTRLGGSHLGGTLYKMSTTGSLTVLYDFPKRAGAQPYENPSDLFEGSDDNLYGTTEYGGTYQRGSVYRIPLAP
ncbi:MAG TPA: choice-of-anchor tandem repeat GloVer-containing protein, partial [Chthonomonadales bacterium]|nr:choice-of-anchor tandem repeat GloVer-containing protein [Chthonomonadales bacterium]